MSQRDLTRPRNIGIGAMAAPLLIVGALAMLNGASEPSTSAAADVQAPLDPETVIRATMGALTEPQQAALQYREQIPVLSETDSPFQLIEEITPIFSDDPDIEIPEPVAGPTFTVSAMMGSKAGHIVLINGKAHRAGDQLEGGWRISKINASAKQVIVEDGGGRAVTLDLNSPQAMPAPSR